MVKIIHPKIIKFLFGVRIESDECSELPYSCLVPQESYRAEESSIILMENIFYAVYFANRIQQKVPRKLDQKPNEKGE